MLAGQVFCLGQLGCSLLGLLKHLRSASRPDGGWLIQDGPTHIFGYWQDVGQGTSVLLRTSLPLSSRLAGAFPHGNDLRALGTARKGKSQNRRAVQASACSRLLMCH